MKAIVYAKYGGPEVLQVQEIEKPKPKDDEVLIKVYAVSINDWDWGLLQGDFSFFSGRPLPVVIKLPKLC